MSCSVLDSGNNLVEIGSYKYSNTGYYINVNSWNSSIYLYCDKVSSANDISSVINNLLNRVQPPKVDFSKKPYITKWCKIPRYKVDEFTQANGIKRVWDFRDSNYVVLSKEELKKTTMFEYRSEMFNGFTYVMTIDNFKKHFPNETNDLKYHLDKVYIISEIEFKQLEPDCINIGKSANIGGNLGRIGIIDIIKEYINNPGKFEIIFDHEFITEVNSEGLELGEEELENIKYMLNTKNVDNMNLAVEMLANINLDKHVIDLACLFNRFHWNFYRNSGVTKNQAFQILKSFLKSHNIEYTQKWRVFIPSLVKKFPDQKVKITKYMLEMLNSEFEYHKLNFKLNSIDVSFN